MKKHFVTYNIAKAMKKLGFDETCLGAFKNKELEVIEISKELIEDMNTPISKLRKTEIMLAPTWEQAFDWFREKFNIHKAIKYSIESESFLVHIIKNNDDGEVTHSINLSTFQEYKDARSACIKKIIEILN